MIEAGILGKTDCALQSKKAKYGLRRCIWLRTGQGIHRSDRSSTFTLLSQAWRRITSNLVSLLNKRCQADPNHTNQQPRRDEKQDQRCVTRHRVPLRGYSACRRGMKANYPSWVLKWLKAFRSSPEPNEACRLSLRRRALLVPSIIRMCRQMDGADRRPAQVPRLSNSDAPPI
jgi:hypothetical protein